MMEAPDGILYILTCGYYWFMTMFDYKLQDEFEYKYTDCDGAGKHWRVAVPKSGTSIDCQMPAPVLGPNCGKLCSNWRENVRMASISPVSPKVLLPKTGEESFFLLGFLAILS